MYDVLFLSRLIPSVIEDEVRLKMNHTMDDAALAWQKHIIEGLDKSFNNLIQLVNYLPVRSWPKYYKDSFVDYFVFSHNGVSTDINIPFCNITLIKRLVQGKVLNDYVRRWALNGSSNRKVIISYSLYPEFLDSIRIAKENNSSIISAAIVLDLPQYSIITKKMTLLNGLYLFWSRNKATRLLNSIDCFVLLTEAMKEPLRIKDKPYCIVEGIYSNEFDISKKEPTARKTILYAGTLHARFGIISLLEAFEKIQRPDFQLLICGFGDSEREVIKMAKKDNRVVFFGQLPRDKIIPLIQRASVIVNPRKGVEEYTKYSFPSKNLEALSSGVPFVGYKLPGIPDEYDEFINYPRAETVEALSEILEIVCDDRNQQYTRKAERAREWVKRYKNNLIQANKITSLIDSLV